MCLVRETHDGQLFLARTMPDAAARPSPRPTNFVVKKGSKILAFVSSSIPWPVSCTSKQIYFPGRISFGSEGVLHVVFVDLLHARGDHDRTTLLLADGFCAVDNQVHHQLLNLAGAGWWLGFGISRGRQPNARVL